MRFISNTTSRDAIRIKLGRSVPRKPAIRFRHCADMSGNVAEWVADDFHSNYEDAPSDGNTPWITGESEGVARGGSWIQGKSM